MRAAVLLAVLACSALIAVQAQPGPGSPMPPIPTNWFAPNFYGVLEMDNQKIELQGNMVWQMDASEGGYNRSAYVSVTGIDSTFLDWDGKTYGTPAVYYYDVGYHCQCWCELLPSDQCGEAEGFCNYDMLTSSQFANSTIVDGQAVNTWVWNDTAVFGHATNALYFLNSTSLPFYRTNYAVIITMPKSIVQTYGGFRGGLPDNDNWFNVPYPNYCGMCDDQTCDLAKSHGPSSGIHPFIPAIRRMQKEKQMQEDK